jgi:hypothetical protein
MKKKHKATILKTLNCGEVNTEFSSTRIDGNFFSVAITTPLEAA